MAPLQIFIMLCPKSIKRRISSKQPYVIIIIDPISVIYVNGKIFLSKFQTEGLTNKIPLEYTLTGGFIVHTDFNAITPGSLFVALSEFQTPHPFRSVFINPHLINQILFF